MQKRDLIHESSSMFSYCVIKYSHFKRCFEKSENAIQWVINLALLSFQSIIYSQMIVSEIQSKAEATACVLMSTLKL